MAKGFLPVTAQEMRALGWEQPDFVYVTGDAYVDHPTFGAAVSRAGSGRENSAAIAR